MDSVEKIEISLEIIENNNISLYKSEITEKDLMQDFCNEMSEIKAKRIVNGGGENSNITIYIRVYYIGEKLEYYTIYGNQIEELFLQIKNVAYMRFVVYCSL